VLGLDSHRLAQTQSTVSDHTYDRKGLPVLAAIINTG